MLLSHRTAWRILVLLLAPGALGACTMVGSQAPLPQPVPAERDPAPTSGTVPETETARITSGVVELALEAIGTPYVWGGTDANGFDCSGLIQYAYAQFGIVVPRVSTAQIQSGSPVPLDPGQLRPGDILGFSLDDPDKTSHVGLYVGNYEFIHSGSSGVRIASILNTYWQDHLIAARQVVQ
jgi:cell wall-associated NlpC family hydrolase